MSEAFVTPDDEAETPVWRLAAPLKLHFDHFGLYGHGTGAGYAADRECFRLGPGGTLRFDRLLNIFPYRKWIALTGVTDLVVRVVHAGGPCTLSVIGFDGQATRLVWATELPASDEVRTSRFTLPSRLNLADFLFVQLDAEERAEVHDVALVTRAPAANPVRLGIVITTFNRNAEVEEQVTLLEDLEARGLDYHVYVVDNGRNLELSRRYGATTVVPNPNLGGAGGFTRGLLGVLDEGSFTHAMFMDDDAFCHPEAIVRAAAMLAYAKDPLTAFTGAMNYLHAPAVQYELGGRLAPYGVSSVRMDVNTSEIPALHANETAPKPDYGAWWCFLFPVSAVEVLPFPFFVRGDDIAFSLQNRFKLETLPGLVAWQPSFEFKIGPPVEYLVHRSFLTMPLLAPRPQWSKASILAGVRAAFDLEVDGLRYPIAEAICRALEDVMTGPSFWLNTANTTARMQELADLDKAFSARSFLPDWGHLPPGTGTRLVIRLLRKVLGDANIPARLCPRRPALTNNMGPARGQAFLRRGMIYHAPDGSRTMSCVRDWRWRRRLERRFGELLAEYEDRFDELARAYAAAREPLQSAMAWRERLGMSQPERSLANTAV